MSKSASTMRAGQLSAVLIGILIALICILIGGSLFAASLLIKKSTAATHAQIDASVSADDASRLEALKAYLAKNATGIAQTAALTSGLGQYDQNGIVATINGYASKAGVSITSFSFGTGGSGTAAGTAASAASTAGTVQLTLGSPLQYQNFIVFLRLLEQGLMPAQVTSATISANSDDPGTISVSSLSVKVVQ